MDKIDPHLRQAAALMAQELEATRLEVIAIPSTAQYQPTQRKRRVVITQNPKWYQNFCGEWPKNRTKPRRKRKPDTRITRRETFAALYEIAAGAAKCEYAQRLLPHVQSYAQAVDNFWGGEQWPD